MIYQINKPNPINVDYLGNTFFPGRCVAFNYQGDVRLGKIENILQNEWKVSRQGEDTKSWWSHKFKMTISHRDDSSRITTVKNLNSFAVID